MQQADAFGDLVADGADLVQGQPGGVAEVPVEVAPARVDGAGVAAAHGDHDVGSLNLVCDQAFGDLAGAGGTVKLSPSRATTSPTCAASRPAQALRPGFPPPGLHLLLSRPSAQTVTRRMVA